MARSGVRLRTGDSAVLKQIDEEERVQQIAMAEHEILVVLDAALAIEVDVEKLAVPKRLSDAVHKVQPRHLLMADLRVHPDHVAMLKGAR